MRILSKPIWMVAVAVTCILILNVGQSEGVPIGKLDFPLKANGGHGQVHPSEPRELLADDNAEEFNEVGEDCDSDKSDESFKPNDESVGNQIGIKLEQNPSDKTYAADAKGKAEIQGFQQAVDFDFDTELKGAMQVETYVEDADENEGSEKSTEHCNEQDEQNNNDGTLEPHIVKASHQPVQDETKVQLGKIDQDFEDEESEKLVEQDNYQINNSDELYQLLLQVEGKKKNEVEEASVEDSSPKEGSQIVVVTEKEEDLQNKIKSSDKLGFHESNQSDIETFLKLVQNPLKTLNSLQVKLSNSDYVQTLRKGLYSYYKKMN